jgi:hypothetical protein
VLITTADQTIAEQVTSIITQIVNQAGIDKNIVNVEPLPTESDNPVRLGLSEQADDLMTLARFTYPNNPVLAQEYQQNPPVFVFRTAPRIPFKGNMPRPLAPLNAPDRGTGTNEEYLREAQDILVTSLIHSYKKTGRDVSTAQSIPLSFLTGETCIRLNISCMGDTQDAVYSATRETFSLDENDLIIIIGINHTQTRKASYTNVSFYNSAKMFGIRSFSDRNMEGSIASLLTTANFSRNDRRKLEAAGDQLYIYTIARDCTGRNYCIEVPTGNMGVNYDETLRMVTRAYIEPGTIAGPAYDELLYPRYLIITPN